MSSTTEIVEPLKEFRILPRFSDWSAPQEMLVYGHGIERFTDGDEEVTRIWRVSHSKSRPPFRFRVCDLRGFYKIEARALD